MLLQREALAFRSLGFSEGDMRFHQRRIKRQTFSRLYRGCEAEKEGLETTTSN
jgi:hypothetical protein